MAAQRLRDLHFATASPSTTLYTASIEQALTAALPTPVEAKVVGEGAGEWEKGSSSRALYGLGKADIA